MLYINKLTILKKLDMRELLRDCTFSVLPHQKIGIIGEEGNGKSTLLKAILDPKLIENYCNVQGFVQHENLVLGYLPQRMPEIWKDISVWEYFFKKDPNSDCDYQNINNCYSLLSTYQLNEEDLYDKKCGECSGGEQVKIQLIKLQMQNPDLYLLDEPTNDLDIDTLTFLEEFMSDENKTILFISHDETLLRNVATGILHLEQIHRKTQSRWTFENIEYDEYLEKRNLLKNRQNQISDKQHAEYRAKMDRYNRLYQKVNHALNTVSRQDPHTGYLLKKKMKSVKALGKRMDKEQEDLTKRFDGEEEINFFFQDFNIPSSKKVLDYQTNSLTINGKELCKNIDLQIYSKQKVAIVGKNGCGKSTLLKLIINQIESQENVGYMPQNYEDYLDPNSTVLDFLCKDRDKATQSMLQTFLGSLKFTADEMNQTCKECSEGQKAKLYLIKLMFDKKTFLILDEPTRNLSPLTNPIIRKALHDYPGTILFVSHDRLLLEEVATQILVMNESGLHIL